MAMLMVQNTFLHDRFVLGIINLHPSVVFSIRLIPESFRWSITKGRYENAESVISSISKMNGRKVPDITEIVEQAKVEDAISAKHHYTALDMFKTRENIIKSTALLFIWSVIYIRTASSEKVLLNMRTMCRFRSLCVSAKCCPDLCSPFIYSVVSNDFVSGQ